MSARAVRMKNLSVINLTNSKILNDERSYETIKETIFSVNLFLGFLFFYPISLDTEKKRILMKSHYVFNVPFYRNESDAKLNNKFD